MLLTILLDPGSSILITRDKSVLFLIFGNCHLDFFLIFHFYHVTKVDKIPIKKSTFIMPKKVKIIYNLRELFIKD